jgi:hypothetical protein
VNSRTSTTRSTTPPPPSPVTPPVQLRLGENPAQLLQRHRSSVAAVVDAGSTRRRYGPGVVELFALLADHTNADGIGLVSAADLALVLRRDRANVRTDLRALAAGGFVIPLERVDGVYVAATRHPRHRVGYLVPGMVAPSPVRPHVVR